MNDESTYYESKFEEAHQIIRAATEIKKNEDCGFIMIGIDKTRENTISVMGCYGGKMQDLAEALIRILTGESEGSEQMRQIIDAAIATAKTLKKKGTLRSIFGARKQ